MSLLPYVGDKSTSASQGKNFQRWKILVHRLWKAKSTFTSFSLSLCLESCSGALEGSLVLQPL